MTNLFFWRNWTSALFLCPVVLHRLHLPNVVCRVAVDGFTKRKRKIPYLSRPGHRLDLRRLPTDLGQTVGIASRLTVRREVLARQNSTAEFHPRRPLMKPLGFRSGIRYCSPPGSPTRCAFTHRHHLEITRSPRVCRGLLNRISMSGLLLEVPYYRGADWLSLSYHSQPRVFQRPISTKGYAETLSTGETDGSVRGTFDFVLPWAGPSPRGGRGDTLNSYLDFRPRRRFKIRG